MRVRLRFSKLGKVRFTSHRDVARIWERALRRAALPVAYTEGFSPRPRLSFGLALSTGYESLGEYLDVELASVPEARADAEPMADQPVGHLLDELPGRLSAVLPHGLDVQASAPVASGTPSLQQAVTSCTWTIEVLGLGPVAADVFVQQALAADQLVARRARKGHEVTDDLRPFIRSLAVVGPTAAGTELEAELGTQPRSLRPSELLTALAPELEEGRVCRTHQWLSLDGARREPIPLGATWAPHAPARAS